MNAAQLSIALMDLRRPPICVIGAILLCISITGSVIAQESNVTAGGKERRQYLTQSTDGASIKLDGIIDEEVWNRVPWSSDFIEYQPDDGTPPSQQTSFKVMHDEKFLYLA